MRIRTKQLPATLQSALRSVGYGRADIGVEIKAAVSIRSFGSDGCRAFACIVDLATGAKTLSYGSWGGPNAFTRNSVDDDETPVPLTADTAIILGSEGGGRPVGASITLGPDCPLVDQLAPRCTTHADCCAHPGLARACALRPVDDRGRCILSVFCGLKPAYRREYLERLGATAADIDALVRGGFLKRNAAGAVTITTEGKNACAGREAA